MRTEEKINYTTKIKEIKQEEEEREEKRKQIKYFPIALPPNSLHLYITHNIL